MAAADKAAIASGADLGDGLRQRPVAGQSNLQPPTPQPEDNKKLVKKVLFLTPPN
jgi:dolichyl-phosphate-mannose-protein mannosyltransferase